MEFERTNPDCKFTIPDKITVRAQMAYFSSYPSTGSIEYFLRKWLAARVLITEWICELFPDKEADLDSVADPKITQILIWAGNEVGLYIDRLESVPKN